MRLDSLTIINLTGRKRRSAQVAWFLDNFGVEIPCDHIGPIITEQAYEKLLEKRLGILSSPDQKAGRPMVKLLRKKLV